MSRPNGVSLLPAAYFMALLGLLDVSASAAHPDPSRVPSPREYPVWRLLPPDDIENVKEALRLGLDPNHPLVRALERNGMFATPPESEHERGELSKPAHRFDVVGSSQLATDALVNLRPAPCTPCPNKPPGQVEPSVAIHGNDVVVAFNDYGASCRGGTRENFGYSTDGGATFTDALAYLSTTSGTLFGDPSAAVNHKTGQFYMGGLHSTTGSGGFDVGAVRGFFSGNAFVKDLGRRAVTNPDHATYFFDRPFMAVDSLTGNVYFTWASFGPVSDAIEFQACDSLLNPITPIMVMAPEDTARGYQDAQPTVGPDGVVYVTWWETRWFASDLIMVRRSDDHGLTFGPPVAAAAFAGNAGNPPPGGQRLFSYVVPSITLDNTQGPHRGRVYLSWEGTLDYYKIPFSTATAAMEVEPNNTLATANSFVPGGKIRGTMNNAESDFYEFTGTQGQTLVLDAFVSLPFDSSTIGYNARIHYLSNPADPTTDRVVSDAGLYLATILYTLPNTGTYFVEVYRPAGGVGTYVFETALIGKGPDDIARDERDPLFAWSDDGVHWSTPVQLADDPPWFDSVFPSLAVDGEGRVHCFWLDYRDDPVYATECQAFTTSSGDGGLTWGANRPIADAGSYWPTNMCLSNANSIGDYMQMAADGDRVVAAFTDPRLGDSDIWVDGSLHAQMLSCPGTVTISTSADTVVDIGLVNAGNYTRTLHWSITDSHGWVTGAAPGTSGTQTLDPGQQVTVKVTIVPSKCNPDSTVLTSVMTDPAFPGSSTVCTTVVRCLSTATPTLVSLVGVDARPDRVALRWQSPAAPADAVVERRTGETGWLPIGQVRFDASGLARFEDRDVSPAARYAYRLAWSAPDGEQFSAESWVDVPKALELALESPRPNPATDQFELGFSLPTSGPATLALVDVSGREHLVREVGGLGPGHHAIRLEGSAGLPAGLYWLRLSQSGRTITRPAVLLR